MKIQHAIDEARASGGRTVIARASFGGRTGIGRDRPGKHPFQIRFRGLQGEIVQERHWGAISFPSHGQAQDGWSNWRPHLGFHVDDVMADDWTVETLPQEDWP